MGRIRLVLGILATLASGAQVEDIQQRVLRALTPEEGQRAEIMLRSKRFVDVEPMVPATNEGWAIRGALEFLAGRMDGAAKCFEEARRLGELHESDEFTMAMAEVQLQQYDKAGNELTKLAARHPQNALYEYWLGRVAYGQRRYPEAVEKLKKATELDGNSARAWDSLGLAYDMQGQVDFALKAFEEGARINRGQAHGSAWPPHDLGVLLLRMGDNKRAEKAFREALRFDPQMPEAHYHLGRALEKAGTNEEAVREYVRALEADRKAADVCYSLALLYRKMRRDQEAEAMFAEWRRRRDASK